MITITTYPEYRGRKHFPALDGFRGVCILLVLLAHSVPQSPAFIACWRWVNGGLGVNGFFVLSGFLITTLALREEEERGAFSLKNFYIRRAFRIFPLYFLTVAVYAVLCFGFRMDGGSGRMAAGLPYFLTFTNEFAPVTIFAQGWSLGVEEKFYLLWPVLGFVLWRSAPEARLKGTLALIALPYVFGYAGGLFYRGRAVNWLCGYSLIMVGALLAQCLHRPDLFRRIVPLAAGPWWAIFLVALHLSFGFFQDFHTPLAATYQLVYAFAVAIFLVPLLTTNPPWARVLESKALTLIGRRSYGIYLIHTLCLALVYRAIPPGGLSSDLARLAALPLLCLAVAEPLYRWIERPMIDIGRGLMLRTP